VRGTELDIYTYRPDCPDPRLLLVFHGSDRNAADYRDNARPLADKGCMIVVAPLFDAARFKDWQYQHGGIVHRNSIQKSDHWTGKLIVSLIDHLRKEEGRRLDVYMIGHSAGAQFLSRVAAFIPNDARRMVIANPSSYVWPNLDRRAPFGMGGVYGRNDAENNLRRYLAAPVTIVLGEKDTGKKHLSEKPEARAQGLNRLERGRNAFAAAKATAQSHGWPFNWHLVEIPGVGHSARKVFASAQALEELK
jgi:dienelactone hydrolase